MEVRGLGVESSFRRLVVVIYFFCCVFGFSLRLSGVGIFVGAFL